MVFHWFFIYSIFEWIKKASNHFFPPKKTNENTNPLRFMLSCWIRRVSFPKVFNMVPFQVTNWFHFQAGVLQPPGFYAPDEEWASQPSLSPWAHATKNGMFQWNHGIFARSPASSWTSISTSDDIFSLQGDLFPFFAIDMGKLATFHHGEQNWLYQTKKNTTAEILAENFHHLTKGPRVPVVFLFSACSAIS